MTGGRRSTIVLASSNPGKLREIQAILADSGVEVRPQNEFNVDDAAETGLTFIENAIIKARNASRTSGRPALADDSGLCVDALGGGPGVRSARYAGPGASDADNVAKLLAALADVPAERRGARFQCVLALLRHADDPMPVICQGTWAGSIQAEPTGTHGFGYDPVFHVPDHGCSAAELDRDTKNRLSHRGRALADLKRQLSLLELRGHAEFRLTSEFPPRNSPEFFGSDEREPMTLKLDRLKEFTGRPGPVLLAIADGVGIAPDGPANAVYLADTPTMDRLLASPLRTQLKAHGTGVGLPSDDDMGNSEVGHNALGGGRVFAQGAKLVNQALASGELFEGKLWQRIVESGSRGATVHFLGLLSDGNVHSHVDHLFTLVTECARRKVGRVRLHVLLDGRDVAARSALTYIGKTEALLSSLNEQHGVDYRIASGGGRMRITMDRYNADWEMVERGYHCHVHGVGRVFHSAESAVQTLYAEDDDVTDQTLEPFVITENSEPVGRIADGDAVVLFNFRGDRAIEISRAFEEGDFDRFDREPRPNVLFAGMLEYDGDLRVPKNYLVAPPVIDRTVSEYLCAEGVPSFAISETQKYGHVTYFWNGNRSGYIDEDLETYIEIPSDNVPFDKAPGMKAVEITDKTIELMQTGDYRFGRLNFANGDMVGHTGNLDATVAAMETVDRCLARLVAAVDELGGILVFTADHGNAEDMFTEKDGERLAKTSHTLNPVPFVIHDPRFREEYAMAAVDAPGLKNVAATLLNLLGYRAPSDYQPSLIEFR